jgi:glycosyltransferase involved in cell wall biosynthesis
MKKWAIMIVTQPSRKRYLERLLGMLQPQADEFPEVEVKVHLYQSGAGGLGMNRLSAIKSVDAEYVSFIDDDDLVAKDYVKRILPLLDGVDNIGFIANSYYKGQPGPVAIHSLKCGCWGNDGNGQFLRDLTPFNPIKRELALQGDWSGDYSCDVIWADSMRGKVKTEHYIDDAMYLYFPRGGEKNEEKDYPGMYGDYS